MHRPNVGVVPDPGGCLPTLKKITHGICKERNGTFTFDGQFQVSVLQLPSEQIIEFPWRPPHPQQILIAVVGHNSDNQSLGYTKSSVARGEGQWLGKLTHLFIYHTIAVDLVSSNYPDLLKSPS